VSDRPAPVGRTLELGVAASERRRLAAASLLGAAAIGATVALMGTSAWLISRAAEHPPEASLTLAIVGVQFFGLSRGFLRYAERLVGHDAALRTLAALRVRIYQQLEALAPAGLPVFRRGDLVARFVGDVDSLQDVVLRVVVPFATAAFVGMATVAVLWWFLPSAGLVVLMALGVAATVVPWLSSRLARRSDAALSTARGALTADVLDLVEGAPELVVLGGTEAQLSLVERSDERLRTLARRGAGTAGVGLGLSTALAGLASWGALVLGVRATGQGSLDGTLLAVLALVPLAAFELVSPLPAATQSFQRCRVAAGRVADALDAPPAVPEPQGTAATPGPDRDGGHTLALRGVWASYPGARRAALRGVDLDLRPGRRIALVGPSGAGKSTLADVLVRFLPADAGRATLDGVPLERLAGDDVRRVVGLVEQHAHLFDTTLAENLRIGRRDADDAALDVVLGRVGLGDWVRRRPDGLRTGVGPDGSRLSGGQRQRVAVARALLADFPILVLDEPTEHLDATAADALTAELLAHRPARATLLITHRLVGLEAVDEVLVLDRGAVVERGTHRDLVAAGGRYAALWWEEQLADRGVDRAPFEVGQGPSEQTEAEGGMMDLDERTDRP
jgi:thiol reductant ABC exporter CydC subunit